MSVIWLATSSLSVILVWQPPHQFYSTLIILYHVYLDEEMNLLAYLLTFPLVRSLRQRCYSSRLKEHYNTTKADSKNGNKKEQAAKYQVTMCEACTICVNNHST